MNFLSLGIRGSFLSSSACKDKISSLNTNWHRPWQTLDTRDIRVVMSRLTRLITGELSNPPRLTPDKTSHSVDSVVKLISAICLKSLLFCTLQPSLDGCHWETGKCSLLLNKLLSVSEKLTN